MTSNSQTSFRLPFLFIATGIVSFVLFHILSLSSLAAWTMEYPRGPVGWTNTHLLVLGWGTMVAMGAVYQLMNVVLQKDLYSRPVGYAHYFSFTIGFIGLMLGFYFGRVIWIGAFASLALLGILLFAWNIGAALLHARQWNTVTIGAACAVSYLVLTGLTGLTMGLDFPLNFLGIWHDRFLGAHLWFGAIGWFGLLIASFSFKLLPMFYLSHGHSVRWEKPILILWNGAVILGAIAMLSGAGLPLLWAAFLLLTAAFAAYTRYIKHVMAKKHKSSPGEGIIFSVWAVSGFLMFLLFVLVFAIWFPEQAARTESIVILGWVYLWGWVALTILGYMSKIVPFLWWTHKYGALVGKVPTPSLSQMVNERYVRAFLHLTGTAMLVLILGLSFSWPVVVMIGGCVLSIFSVAYIGLVANVFLK
jgi:hypothetical protein